MSAPRSVHLLCADEVLRQSYWEHIRGGMRELVYQWIGWRGGPQLLPRVRARRTAVVCAARGR